MILIDAYEVGRPSALRLVAFRQLVPAAVFAPIGAYPPEPSLYPLDQTCPTSAPAAAENSGWGRKESIVGSRKPQPMHNATSRYRGRPAPTVATRAVPSPHKHCERRRATRRGR